MAAEGKMINNNRKKMVKHEPVNSDRWLIQCYGMFLVRSDIANELRWSNRLIRCACVAQFPVAHPNDSCGCRKSLAFGTNTNRYRWHTPSIAGDCYHLQCQLDFRQTGLCQVINIIIIIIVINVCMERETVRKRQGWPHGHASKK